MAELTRLGCGKIERTEHGRDDAIDPFATGVESQNSGSHEGPRAVRIGARIGHTPLRLHV